MNLSILFVKNDLLVKYIEIPSIKFMKLSNDYSKCQLCNIQFEALIRCVEFCDKFSSVQRGFGFARGLTEM